MQFRETKLTGKEKPSPGLEVYPAELHRQNFEPAFSGRGSVSTGLRP